MRRFTTLTARYAGTCRRCHNKFEAGTKIRYGGRGMTYHFAKDCPAGKPAAEHDDERDMGAAVLHEAANTHASGERNFEEERAELLASMHASA